MQAKRLLLLAAVILLLFLGLYSWNQRTGYLDFFAEHTGLEIVGTVLHSADTLSQSFTGIWSRYLDLVNVREENERLRQDLENIQSRLLQANEERNELYRLRQLLSLETPPQWQRMGARVIGGRHGANAVMQTIVIDRGYMSGALPDTPVATKSGIIGRVLRSGPTTATVLLVTDPGSRVAVIGQESRTHGLLVGCGPDKPLELSFVEDNAEVVEREILVTSGLDGLYPKGIPVAELLGRVPAQVSALPAISAQSVADLKHLEEVVLMERPVAEVIKPDEGASAQ